MGGTGRDSIDWTVAGAVAEVVVALCFQCSRLRLLVERCGLTQLMSCDKHRLQGMRAQSPRYFVVTSLRLVRRALSVLR